MHLASNILSLLLAFATGHTYAKRYTKGNDAVLLSNVRSLTVQDGKKTTGRRGDPVPQLTCIGGNGKGLYDVDVMQCKNAGAEYDPEDIQWTCHASLPPEFKLGSTDVICEGYDSPEDPYVLKGSCGVEYRLILTELGEEKYPANFWGTRSRKTAEKVDDGWESPPVQSSSERGGGAFAVVFWLVFIGVLIFILYKIFYSDDERGRVKLPDTGRGGLGWGGGGGGDDDDPPPPYTPRRPQTRAKTASSSYSSHGTNTGPGFWSGAGLGGAAGYAAGNYMGGRSERSRRQQQQQQQNNYAAPGPSTYSQGGGSSWFGGGGGRTAPSTYGAGPSTFGGRPSGSSSSSTPSSSRYESTGFGGTRRR